MLILKMPGDPNVLRRVMKIRSEKGISLKEAWAEVKGTAKPAKAKKPTKEKKPVKPKEKKPVKPKEKKPVKKPKEKKPVKKPK
jgi:hypothetical protein